MHRMLFEKKGTAVWISHLDMMRTIQRCFRRANIRIKQTNGFSPHAFVSIALPLPVGTESVCELLDFTLETNAPLETLPAQLNQCAPAGIRFLIAYESDRKIRDLTYLQARVTLCYDNGVPIDAEAQIRALFTRPELLVEKKSKKGMTEIDILPMLQECTVTETAAGIQLDIIVCAQNPSLNPELLIAAVRRYLPQYAPDDSEICRLEILDAAGQPFR